MTITYGSNTDKKFEIRNKKLDKDDSFYEEPENNEKRFDKPWKKGKNHGFGRVSETSGTDDK